MRKRRLLSQISRKEVLQYILETIRIRRWQLDEIFKMESENEIYPQRNCLPQMLDINEQIEEVWIRRIKPLATLRCKGFSPIFVAFGPLAMPLLCRRTVMPD